MINPFKKKDDAHELLKLVYPDLIQPAAKSVGESLKIVVDFLTMPLLFLKYANASVRLRFQKRIDRLSDGLEEIPEDKKCEISSSIGAPAMEQLAIESDEDISDLFISLLVNAASEDTISVVHPRFVTSLKGISGDEAKMLMHLKGETSIPFVVIRMKFDAENGLDKTEILTGIEQKVQLRFPQNIPVYFENFLSLGIVSSGTGALSDIRKWYEPLFAIYDPIKQAIHSKGHDDGNQYDVGYSTGYYTITRFGRMFIHACTSKLPDSGSTW